MCPRLPLLAECCNVQWTCLNNVPPLSCYAKWSLWQKTPALAFRGHQGRLSSYNKCKNGILLAEIKPCIQNSTFHTRTLSLRLNKQQKYKKCKYCWAARHCVAAGQSLSTGGVGGKGEGKAGPASRNLSQWGEVRVAPGWWPHSLGPGAASSQTGPRPRGRGLRPGARLTLDWGRPWGHNWTLSLSVDNTRFFSLYFFRIYVYGIDFLQTLVLLYNIPYALDI